MSTQPRSLREPILSPSDGGINGNTGGWMPRRRLLSSTTTNSQTITTTTGAPANVTSNAQYAPSPSIFAAPAPAPSSAELKPLFIRSKPVYQEIRFATTYLKALSRTQYVQILIYGTKVYGRFETIWCGGTVLGIIFELVGIINAMAANCWFCGPQVLIRRRIYRFWVVFWWGGWKWRYSSSSWTPSWGSKA